MIKLKDTLDVNMALEAYEIQQQLESMGAGDLMKRLDRIKKHFKDKVDQSETLKAKDILVNIKTTESMRFNQKALEADQGKDFVDAYKEKSVSKSVSFIKAS